MDDLENMSDDALDKAFESQERNDDVVETKEASIPEPKGEAAAETKYAEKTDESTPTDTNDDAATKAANYQRAMQEERAQRKLLAARLNESLEKTQKMEERFNEFISKVQRSAQEKAIPPFEEKPIENLKAQHEQLNKKIQEHDNVLQQQTREQETNRQLQEVINRYNREASEFAQQTPEFGEAYNSLRQSRYNELKALGYDDASATNLLIEDELAIVTRAFKDNENPAKRIFEAAKMRGLVRAKETKAVETKHSAAEKLQNIEQGQRKNTGLDTSSMGIDNEPTLEDLANMNDEDFEKTWKKYESKHRNEL